MMYMMKCIQANISVFLLEKSVVLYLFIVKLGVRK